MVTTKRAPRTPKGQTRGQIVAFVTKKGQASTEEIANHLGRKVNTMSGTLSQTVAKGELIRLGRGIFALPGAEHAATNGNGNGHNITRTYTRKRNTDQKVADALTALFPEGTGKGLDPLLLLQWVDITKELVGG